MTEFLLRLGANSLCPACRSGLPRRANVGHLCNQDCLWSFDETGAEANERPEVVAYNQKSAELQRAFSQAPSAESKPSFDEKVEGSSSALDNLLKGDFISHADRTSKFMRRQARNSIALLQGLFYYSATAICIMPVLSFIVQLLDLQL